MKTEASRIANVSAAVLVGFSGQGTTKAQGRLGSAAVRGREGATRDAIGLAARMARIFEDTLWVGDRPPECLSARAVFCPEDRRDFVAGVAAAIEAARGDRVIVVAGGDERASAELLLSLVAWPEAAIVMLSDPEGTGPCPMICRREDLMARARNVLVRTSAISSYASFLAGLDTALVPLARLGLADAPCALFADSSVGSREGI